MSTGNSPGARDRNKGKHNARALVSTGLADQKPKRDRAVDHTTVVCPVHQTPVGEHCIGKQGNRLHCPPRRRMALRLERKLKEEGDQQ